MTQRPVYLIDASAAELGALDVLLVGDHFEGTIVLGRLPDDLRTLFVEFEEVVEGQLFSLLDQVEMRIRDAGLRFRWENGATTQAEDLQVFPSTGAMMFRAVPPPDGPLYGQPAADRPTSSHS
jgi:hypothetical protein